MKVTLLACLRLVLTASALDLTLGVTSFPYAAVCLREAKPLLATPPFKVQGSL